MAVFAPLLCELATMAGFKWISELAEQIAGSVKGAPWAFGLSMAVLGLFLHFNLRDSFLELVAGDQQAIGSADAAWIVPDNQALGYRAGELRRTSVTWGEVGTRWYVRTQWTMDFLFPLVIVGAFIAWAAPLQRPKLTAAVVTLSMCAVLCDYTENLLLIAIFSLKWFDQLAWVAAGFTRLKMLTYVAGMVIIGVAWMLRLLSVWCDAKRREELLRRVGVAVRLRFPAMFMLVLLGWGFAATQIEAVKPLAANVLLLEGLYQVGLLAAVNALAIIFCIAIFRALRYRLQSEEGVAEPSIAKQPWGWAEYSLIAVTASITPLYAYHQSLYQLMFAGRNPSIGVFMLGYASVAGGIVAAVLLMICLGYAVGWVLGQEKGKSNFFPGEDRDQQAHVLKVLNPNSHFDLQMLMYFSLLAFLYLIVVSRLSLTQSWISVPTYVVILLWLVLMALAALGAWLDRSRIPITVILLAYIVLIRLFNSDPGSLPAAMVSGNESQSNSARLIKQLSEQEAQLVKLIKDEPSDERRQPAVDAIEATQQEIEQAVWEVVTARFARETKASSTLVVVTCPGGGIHAAAWTAHVLESLDRRYSDFSSSICLISSVSGGSVGTLFFASARQTLPSGEPLDGNQWKLAAQSSLESISKGLAMNDFPAALNPLIPTTDRGTLLEEAWKERLPGTSADHTLKNWETLAFQGAMPIIVMNATDAASGRRIQFSTVALPRRSSLVRRIGRPWDYRELLQDPNEDLHMATAARASATFPYVSPFTHPQHPNEEIGEHVAIGDGGYADNEGLVTAIDWLDFIGRKAEEVKRNRAQVPFKRILLLRIQPGSDLESSTRTESPSTRLQQQTRWLAGPLEALATIRTSSQVERGQLESDLASSYTETPWWKDDATTSAEQPLAQAPNRLPMRLARRDMAAQQMQQLDLELELERNTKMNYQMQQSAEAQSNEPSPQPTETPPSTAFSAAEATDQSPTSENQTSFKTEEPVIMLSIPYFHPEADQSIPLNWKLSNRQQAWYPNAWQSMVEAAERQSQQTAASSSQQNWLQRLDGLFQRRPQPPVSATGRVGSTEGF